MNIGAKERAGPGKKGPGISGQKFRLQRKHLGNYAAVDRYLQPAQDDEAQPPQPALPEEPVEALLEDLPMPKRDRRFSVFFEPHFSQHTSGFDPKTSFSKSVLQSLQWYS